MVFRMTIARVGLEHSPGTTSIITAEEVIMKAVMRSGLPVPAAALSCDSGGAGACGNGHAQGKAGGVERSALRQVAPGVRPPGTVST
jgi:hypothetical protein